MRNTHAIPFSFNAGGRLVELAEPQIMGILNVTPDSFFAASRREGETAIVERARQIVDEGALVIDVGGCSTRPGSEPVTEEEEKARLGVALKVIRRELPDALLSVDTFRPRVAEWAVGEYGVTMVNDVSGGADPAMFPLVARLRVPYVLTYAGSLAGGVGAVMCELSKRVAELRELGAKDVLLDPGFGFGKTLDENYELLSHLSDLRQMELPLLVGVSRKSMVHRLLGITADEALNGTTVLHTLALERGADMLRVHDVRAAAEAIRIVAKMSKE